MIFVSLGLTHCHVERKRDISFFCPDSPNFYRLETSRYDLGKYDAFIETPLDNTGGSLHLPHRAGLGITMNLEYLRANAVDGFGG